MVLLSRRYRKVRTRYFSHVTWHLPRVRSHCPCLRAARLKDSLTAIIMVPQAHTHTCHAPCTPHIPFRSALAVLPSTKPLTAINRVHRTRSNSSSSGAYRNADKQTRRATHSTATNNLHDRSSQAVFVRIVHLPHWESRLVSEGRTTTTTRTRLIGKQIPRSSPYQLQQQQHCSKQ
jgi:hypothetical protein